MIEITAAIWGKPSLIVASMQETAEELNAWAAYMALTMEQKSLFREIVSEEFVVKLTAIIAERPRSRAVIAAPVRPATPWPERLNGTNTNDERSFADWIIRQATLVSQHGGLKFSLGTKYTLSDGTVSVPVGIDRDNQTCGNTSFVFHYHPGVKGARVGHAHASQGHFKPNDGTSVRAKDHNFSQGTPARQLYSDAKRRAK